jgi:hypothetical protein
MAHEATVEATLDREVEVAVAVLGPTLRRIELRGALTVGWAGRLASGLAGQRIDIVRGWARDRGLARWDAQLEVEVPASTGLTPALVLKLCAPETTPLRVLGEVELLTQRCIRTGEDVVVEIEAADGRGFLDRTLRLFALYGLFPREMQIETADGMAHDLFWLRNLHGGAPEQAPFDALASKLRRLTLP